MNTRESHQCAQGAARHHHQVGEAGGEDSRLQEQRQHIRQKLLVMSGKGGVGKTSVAVYLALGLAKKGYQVGLLDVDLHGPDVPRMLGISGKFAMDAEGHLIPHRYHDHLQVVSIECLLHNRDEAVIWRGPLKHNYIRQSMGHQFLPEGEHAYPGIGGKHEWPHLPPLWRGNQTFQPGWRAKDRGLDQGAPPGQPAL